MMKQYNHIYWGPLAILLMTQVLTAIPVRSVSILSVFWFVWIIICSYYAFTLLFKRKDRRENPFAIMILIFWGMNAISYLISPKIVSSYYATLDTLNMFKSSTIALFSYFPFYYYSRKGVISPQNIKVFIFLLFITIILRIYFGNIQLSIEKLETNNVLNQAYLFVGIIPIIFVFFQRRQLYFLIVLATFFVLWGSKRGAILCMAVELLVFIIYLMRYDYFGKKHRGLLLFIIILLSIAGAYYIGENEFLLRRLTTTGTEDDRSGEIRTEMYKTLYGVFVQSRDEIEMLLGRGFGQTVSITGNLAHNDWLELLIDNGIIGLSLYIVLIILCAKNLFNKPYMPKIIKYTLFSCILVWLLTATYSMMYASRDSFIFFIALGMIDGIIISGQKR